MIKSMTGFGKSSVNLQGKVVSMELKSLNSKQLDLNIKLPSVFREKEPEMRSIIAKALERGKVELTGSIDYTDGELPSGINQALVKGYYKELKNIADSLAITHSDILMAVMRLPEVLKPTREVLSEADWEEINGCLERALQSLDEFRVQEGKMLEADFVQRIENIMNLSANLNAFEEERSNQFREKLRSAVSEFAANNTLDSNRFEQEIIYYLEKLDITEEKVRLGKHLQYFLDTLRESEANGRKLSFVTQEIGREINTIGSKANDANIQKVVVQMKDELEKIKEQLANIL